MTNTSLLRRLIGWYALLFLALCLGVSAIYYQLHSLRQTTRQKVQQYQSVQSTALNLESELAYVAYLGYNYLLLEHEHIAARAKGVWERRLEVYTDSLGVLSQKIKKDVDTQRRIIQVRRDLVLLQEQWDAFFKKGYSVPKSQSKRLNQLDKDFDLRLNKIRLELLNISASQESNLKFALSEVENTAQRLRDYSLAAIAITFFVGLLIAYVLLRQVLREQKYMEGYVKELLEGQLPEPLPETYKETAPLRKYLIELRNSFVRLRDLAEQVGKGEFDTHIRAFADKGLLGKSLAGMRESLQLIATENRRRNWFNEGYAQFSEILRNSQREDKNFYEAVLRYLVGYLDIQQGGIFVLAETGEEAKLVLRSAYAFGRSKYPDKSFRYGEGLVGETWREGTLRILTEIPEKYAEITSGLGKAKPKCILLAPLITNEEFVGVLELAAFQPFEAYQIDFINRVAESISATIARLKIDAETEELLLEFRVMAEKMTAQEEENRQNMEVLLRTQTQLEQQAMEMQAQLRALDNSFIRMELNKQGVFTKVNELITEISGYTESELVGKHFSILLGPKGLDENTEKEWVNVLGGQYVQGEFRRYTKSGQKFWIYEVIYPIFNKDGIIDNINIVGYDITKQKEQEFKIKEQLNELQMSRRDVVNRIREVESKARNRMEKMKLDFLDQLQEKERIIVELKSD